MRPRYHECPIDRIVSECFYTSCIFFVTHVVLMASKKKTPKKTRRHWSQGIPKLFPILRKASQIIADGSFLDPNARITWFSWPADEMLHENGTTVEEADSGRKGSLAAIPENNCLSSAFIAFAIHLGRLEAGQTSRLNRSAVVCMPANPLYIDRLSVSQ